MPNPSSQVVIASQLGPEVDDLLRAHTSKPTLIEATQDHPWDVADRADVLLVRPSPAWRLQSHDVVPPGWPGRIRWAFSATAGVDFYPRWLLRTTQISCARGVASEEIAEYVIAAILAQTKNLDGIRAHSLADWRPITLGQVRGSTVGIVGLGTIGSAVAARALALGARVIAVRRRPLPSPIAGVEMYESLIDLIEESDHIVLALPATPASYALLDGKLLANMKQGAHLVNVARGTVLDQSALLEALDDGPLGYATLDVTEPEPLPDGHPLYRHPKVRLTPHVASLHPTVQLVLANKILDNLERYLRGEPLRDVVDPLTGY